MSDSHQETTGQRFGPIVDVDWLLDHLGEAGLRVVDARPPGGFGLGHIPGAVAVDVHAIQLHQSDPEAVHAFQERARHVLSAAGISNGDRVVFYEEISGTLAARGVWLLDYLGLGNGAMLDGGLQAWDARGGPLTTAPVDAAPTSGELTIAPRPEVLATADEIVTSLREDQQSVQLVDVRNDVEHLSGAIPGSVSLRWTNTLGPDGALRPTDDLRTLYDRAGLDPNRETITYCSAGFRAAHAYVVMKALGFGNVRNYAPSWTEWRTREDLPVTYPGR